VAIDGRNYGEQRNVTLRTDMATPWFRDVLRVVVCVRFSNGCELSRTVTVKGGCVSKLSLKAPSIGPTLYDGPRDVIVSLAFSSDGRRILTGSIMAR